MLKPKKPQKPCPPSKTLKIPGKRISLCDGDNLAYVACQFECTWEDLEIEFEYNWENTETFIKDPNVYEIPNSKYKQQFAKYEKDLEKYKLKLEAFKDEEAQYLQYLREEIKKMEKKVRRKDEMDENQ